ncbi:hypothetical protein [Smaragdicoccus niigatensis]|uniref:hypothetical protein n=1 Tax=Smaragdicoccus niigatensis TaxID=359359 RepID=UPI0003A0A0E9|nr:hypothetical protein [Smaragdicoccus niigatensis]
MSYIFIMDSPAGSIENMERILAQIGEEPDGLAARYAGIVDGQLKVIGIWDSKEQADRFFAEKLGPAMAKILGSEGRTFAAPATPPMIGIEVAHSYHRP